MNGATRNQTPKPYHWVLLTVCALFALVEGILDVTGGASPGPFHKIDDIAVRFIGVGLVAFGVLIFTRKGWAFWGLIGFFFLSMLEILMTSQFTSEGARRFLETLLLGIALCVFVGIPVILLICLRHVFVVPHTAPTSTGIGSRTSASSGENSSRRGSSAGRLGELIAQRPDYQIFVGVPLAAPKEWAVATRQGADSVNVQGQGVIHVSDVRAFAVAYTNGQMLDFEPCGLPWPESLTGLSPASQADPDFLREDGLRLGREYVQITYGPSATHPRDRRHYTTSLKNISPERIRVLRFAGYRRSGDGWRLATVTGKFYSSDEFREWYGMGPSEWIELGQVVADLNNYGSPPCLWAYYCESASGKQFVAGGVLE